MTLTALTLLLAALASPQDPAPAPAAAVQEGPRWGVFSRDTRGAFLIDMGGLARDGDVVTAPIARVRAGAADGDFSHVRDTFEIDCAGNRSRLISSADVEADGETGETFPADEPWAAINEGSLDAGIHRMTCGDFMPAGDSYPSVRAYIEAGRP